MIKLKELLNEAYRPNKAELNKIMKVIRKFNPPFAIVVIQDSKVIKQEIGIKDWRLIPAYYRELAKKYPYSTIRVEDGNGRGVVKESTNIKK